MSGGAFRTPSGGRIRRDQPVRFSFDGKSLGAYAGDTVASTLLAHGIHLVARSFKYHRPRGILAAGVEGKSVVFLEVLVHVSTGQFDRHPNELGHETGQSRVGLFTRTTHSH